MNYFRSFSFISLFLCSASSFAVLPWPPTAQDEFINAVASCESPNNPRDAAMQLGGNYFDEIAVKKLGDRNGWEEAIEITANVYRRHFLDDSTDVRPDELLGSLKLTVGMIPQSVGSVQGCSLIVNKAAL